MTDQAVALAGLVMGFFGSSHCVGMCGGIAAALSTPGAAGSGDATARVLASNAGRIASYGLVGALAGAFGASLAALAGPTGAFALRALAAALIVAAGLYLAGWSTAILRVEAAGGSWWRLRVAPAARRVLASRSVAAPFAFGALWGFLPCGLVYSALAVAAASGSAASGAAAMIGFGLGTLPATAVVALAASRGVAVLRSASARRVAGAVVVAFGVWTFAAAAMAWQGTPEDAPACHAAAHGA